MTGTPPDILRGTKKLIFLVGMPAVGKTYWGERVSKEYGLDLADLDDIIEQRTGIAIPDLFAAKGQEFFREKEHECLVEVIRSTVTDTVVACGGGTPCYYNHMELMKATGTVIYLRAGIPYLLANVERSKDDRPLLSGAGDRGAALTALLSSRKAVYEQAHYILQIEDISLATFGKIISSCINPL